MTSSNGNNFRFTGRLWGEITGRHWIPLTKASDTEFWCFLWSAPLTNGWANNGDAGDLRRHRAHYDVTVMNVYVDCLLAENRLISEIDAKIQNDGWSCQIRTKLWRHEQSNLWLQKYLLFFQHSMMLIPFIARIFIACCTWDEYYLTSREIFCLKLSVDRGFIFTSVTNN